MSQAQPDALAGLHVLSTSDSRITVLLSTYSSDRAAAFLENEEAARLLQRQQELSSNSQHVKRGMEVRDDNAPDLATMHKAYVVVKVMVVNTSNQSIVLKRGSYLPGLEKYAVSKDFLAYLYKQKVLQSRITKKQSKLMRVLGLMHLALGGFAIVTPHLLMKDNEQLISLLGIAALFLGPLWMLSSEQMAQETEVVNPVLARLRQKLAALVEAGQGVQTVMDDVQTLELPPHSTLNQFLVLARQDLNTLMPLANQKFEFCWKSEA